MCLYISMSSLYSQNVISTAGKVKLVEVLAQLQERYQVSFSFNYSLLDGIEVEELSCNSLASCLEAISQQVPIEIENVEGSDYIIIPIRRDVAFEVVEQGSGEPIMPLIVQVNRQKEQYLLPNASKYTLKSLFPTDSIAISSRFYKTTQLSAAQLLALNGSLQLLPDTVYLSEVVFEGYLTSGVDTKLADHSIQVNMKDLGLLAGETDGDILTILKNIPGIRTPDGKPGSLNFRGSTFDQTLIQFDDIPIYHTGHFYGTISPYNPLAVEEIEIYRSTAPAKWSGRVGGFINMSTGNPLADTAQYQFTANTIYAGTQLQVPIIKGKLGISIAARSDYPGEGLAPKLEEFSDLNFQGSLFGPTRVNERNFFRLFDVQFSDINAKLAYQINDDHLASFSFIDISNSFSSDFDSRARRTLNIQRTTLDNWGFTGRLDSKLSDHLSTTFGFSQSQFELTDRMTDLRMRMVSSERFAQNQVRDFRLKGEANWQLNGETNINAGYHYTEHEILFDERNDNMMGNRSRDEEASIHSFFVDLNKNWGSRLVTNFGLHSDYYQPLEEFYFDPRFSFSYTVNDHFFLKGSAGRNRQFIKQQFTNDFDDFILRNQFWFLANDRNPVIVGYQGMFGGLFERAGWLVDLELYAKETNNLDFEPMPNTFSNGTLNAMGADLFVKKRWQNIETWVSYSLSRVETEFEEVETVFYDQPHILNLTGLVNLNRWSVAATWSYISGLPVIIPEIDPNSPNSMGQSELTIPFDDRFPAQHQLDLSITHRFWNKAKSWRGIVGVSFLNVYDKENIINIFQVNTEVNNPYRLAVGFAPNMNINFAF
ncbi:MAG: TonB-dependent receptor plug domain-containing protein [Bacteroidota bacterium]